MYGFILIHILLTLLTAESDYEGTLREDESQYQLVWADEFEKDGAPDPLKWRFESGFVRNQEAQWYQAENATCKNGYLVITGKKEHKPNPAYQAGSSHWKTKRQFIEYTSASVVMKREHAFTYGRLEVKAKIDAQAGLWPAIWTVGINGEWPSNGEVDIMEFYNQGILANFAIADTGRHKAIWDGAFKKLDSLGGAEWASKFHIWTLEWDKEKMRILVDGVLFNDINIRNTFNKNDGRNPFQQPHYLLLNLAMGGNRGGSLEHTVLPSTFMIDYVRLYQKEEPKKHSKPNVIVILADDAGYADFGFMGSKDIKTPNLDKLSKDGILFTQHYVSASVCSPSRAGLLTGRYQQRFGHECNLEPEQPLAFDTAQVTIAEALKQQGYRTAILGKWHLGDLAHHHPLNNGFDHFWGFISGGRRYFPDEKDDKPGRLSNILNNHQQDSFQGYLTDVLGDKAVEYVESGRKDQPFFLYLAFNAPHTPMDAKADVLAAFQGKTSRPVYAAMMWSMDEAIGKLIKKLKETGQYDNTLIFFLSDNGGAHNNSSSVAPLKGWKGNEFEGGIRTPLLVSWPNAIKGDKTYTGVASSLDIFKTALSAAGVDQTIPSDGKDLIPFLLSKNYSVNVHDTLFWRKDQLAAARIGDHKLIRLKGERSVLYHLKNDLQEQHDLTAKDLRTSKMLNDELLQWEMNMKRPLWTEPKSWDTVTHMICEDLMNNRPIRVKEPNDLKQTKR